MTQSLHRSVWLCLLLVALLVAPTRVDAQFSDGIELKLDLDTILKTPELWELTPDRLDESLRKEQMLENPYFKWLSTDRTSARFSRRPYSNVAVDLSLFKGQIPVDEVILDFSNGKAVQAYVSLYNRGDSGKMDKADFDHRYKLAGLTLSTLLGVRPAERKPNQQTAVKTAGWLWASPTTLALLEYNADVNTRNGEPEFLRLKMSPPSMKNKLLNLAALGETTTTLSRSDLPKFVKKENNGDVYVSSIPMVDQGDKGYCVTASCQRLFAYLNIACDQHELAQIAGSSATRGTSGAAFTEALSKVDNRFKVRFKPLLEKIPGMDYDVRNARPDRYLKMIQMQIDKGIPLLWALELGLFPEEPAISLQGTGGHMRLIIGYNAEKEQILFSDSWGVGHELKRMRLADAARATYGVYMIEPRAR